MALPCIRACAASSGLGNIDSSDRLDNTLTLAGTPFFCALSYLGKAKPYLNQGVVFGAAAEEKAMTGCQDRGAGHKVQAEMGGRGSEAGISAREAESDPLQLSLRTQIAAEDEDVTFCKVTKK